MLSLIIGAAVLLAVILGGIYFGVISEENFGDILSEVFWFIVWLVVVGVIVVAVIMVVMRVISQ